MPANEFLAAIMEFVAVLQATAAERRRAEELLSSLPGVISARIMADPNGTISEIHVLTSLDVAPKQTVRNIENAAFASYRPDTLAAIDAGLGAARDRGLPIPEPHNRPAVYAAE